MRPKRDSQALGSGSLLEMLPVASPSSITALRAAESLSTRVSVPSSWASSSTGTDTVFEVSPGANRKVPETPV